MSENKGKCACCGKISERFRDEFRYVENSSNEGVYLCVDCYNQRYCPVCKKISYYGGQRFEQYDGKNVCVECVENEVSRIKLLLNGFIQYIKRFYPERKCNEISRDINQNDFIKNNDIFHSAMKSLISGGAHINSSQCLKILASKVENNLDEINVLKAHWNDYILSKQNFLKSQGWESYDIIIEKLYIPKGCKRCGKDIALNYYEGDEYLSVDNINIEIQESSFFELFMRVKKDNSYKCSRCTGWLDILAALRKRFGWNPSWKAAIDDFESFGLHSSGQANPIDFYKILRSHDIVMSQQVIDAWNDIYDSRHGFQIIKCYSVPDSIGGEVQQHMGRVVGGIANGLRKFLG